MWTRHDRNLAQLQLLLLEMERQLLIISAMTDWLRSVTLRHLTTGDSYTTLQYAFRVASPTIKKFVPEVCDAITRAYRDHVMRCPTHPEDWLLVESVFCRRRNFPHALGALDGRHFPIRCPQGGGSLFSKSKGFHCIVFLALVDGDSKFLWVDMGAAGSTSDAQIFKHTDFMHKIEDTSIGFPDSESMGIGGPIVNFSFSGMMPSPSCSG